MRTRFRLGLLCPLVISLTIGLLGCPIPEQTGRLHVVNDLTNPLVGVYACASDAISWGNNRLTAALPTEARLELPLAPGPWDVLVIVEGGEERDVYNIQVRAGQTATVRVSSMRVREPDGIEGEGEEENVLESSGPRPVPAGAGVEIPLSDGTLLTLPPQSGEGDLTTLTLERVTGQVPLSMGDLEQVGTTRVLHFEPFDPVGQGMHAGTFTPSLLVPAADFAGVDVETLAVARVADLYFDGVALPGHTSTLPVQFTEDGDLFVTDFYFPDSLLSSLAHAEDTKQAPIWPREIRYVVGTFQGSYNWKEQPSLVRFYPDAAAAARRSRLGALSAERQEEEARKHIRQALVLVHGHNEEEKLGSSNTTAPAPWRFGYKRDAWTLFYDYLLVAAPELLECTAFYEFIYPTYKPIFTPHAPGQRQDTHFAKALNSMVADGLQVDPEFALFIVGHSQGGVVARAGIQLFEPATHQAFQRLATWGSPHMGSPLVSLRYVLGAPGGIYRAGPDGVVTFPLDNIDNTLFALRRAVDNLQVDAPGTRDLRWANSHTTTPYNLALDHLFSFDVDAAVEPDLWRMYDLHRGTEIYSENLRMLNAEDTYRLSGKYQALYGVTSKRARLTFPLRNWFRPTIEGTDTSLGALVMPWLVVDADVSYEGHPRGSSDGAVPVPSMAAAGIAGGRRHLGDIDHEEYFGAPEPHGVFQAPDEAWTTARETLATLRMPTCPVPGPGQRTFSLTRSNTQELLGYLGGVDAAGNRFDLRFDQTVHMTITVNFDGVQEPKLEQWEWEPETRWNLFVPNYRNPVTVNGHRIYTVGPESFQLQMSTAVRRHYQLKEVQYEQVVEGTYDADGVGRFRQELLHSGQGYTFTFSDPQMTDPLPPDFDGFREFTLWPGVFVLTWDVAEYRYDELVREFEWEHRTYAPNSVPSPLGVHFRLNYRSG